MRSYLQNIVHRLKSYPRIAVILASAAQTPRYAIHWYIILILGMIVALVLVVFAVVAVREVADSTGMLVPRDRSTATFNQEELQDSLTTYHEQETDFELLKFTVPFFKLALKLFLNRWG